MSQKPKRIEDFYSNTIPFPTGTLEEVVAYLTECHTEVLKGFNDKNRLIEGCEIVSVTFESCWYGYEDHEYEVRVTQLETQEHFDNRLAVWKQLEQERRQVAAKAKAARIEIEKQSKIKALENELSKLKGEINEHYI